MGLAGVMFTACDPVMDKGTYESTTITSENFLNGATFAQFDKVIADDGTESYVPSETGNYIQYDFSNVPAVTISYIDKKGRRKSFHMVVREAYSTICPHAEANRCRLFISLISMPTAQRLLPRSSSLLKWLRHLSLQWRFSSLTRALRNGNGCRQK